ncbi:MAG TPA: DUF748 domain-containing protein [Opitutaceae bacterium]|nr:DUF748 domain-containing protein [Opitutaceae bacterium]
MAEPFSILELRRQSAAHDRRGGRWRIVASVVAALFLLFNVFAYFVAPGIFRRQLEHRLAAALHRPVAIQKLRLNPYRLSTTIEGLAIADRDGRPLFGCQRLYVNFDSWSFFSGKWIFQEISLDGPAARLEIDKAGALNISDLIASPAAEPPGAPPPAKPRPLVIRQLTITGARFAFADHSRAQDFATELGPLSFSLKDFSTAPAPGAPYEFTASTEAGEALHWRGTFSAEPLRSAGEFALRQIVLKKYSPYYAGRFGGDILAGTLDFAGRYELDLSTEPRMMRLTGGEVHLRDLQIAPRGAASPVVDLPAVDLTGLDASLAPLKVALAKLVLTGGRIAAQRSADGMINLATLFAPPNGGGTAPAPAAPSVSGSPVAPPDVSLADLEVHGLALSFDDAATPRPAHTAVEALDFSAQNFSLAPSAPPVPFKLAVRFAPQGTLGLDGTFALASRRADTAVDLANFPLAPLGPYVEPFANLRVAQGTVSVRGQLALAAPQIAFRGDADFSQVATVDGAAGDDLASFASLGFEQIDFNSAPFVLGVAQISLVEPALHFTVHHDGSTNLAAVLRRPPPEVSPPAAVPPANAAPRPRITIGRVALSDGRLVFTDRSIEPNAQVAVNGLAGFITDLSSDDSARAAVDLRAKVADTAPVTIAGQVNPLASEAFSDFTASVSDVDLEPAGTYFAKYAGYTLAGGSLSLDLKVSLAQRRLDSQNVATLEQFTLGDKTDSPDATGLPVRLAVALLKDPAGKIVIDLPVQGSLDDPEFRIGRVVLRVIVNLLTKAATAPFSLLGSMFGGGDQQLDRIDFAPGASTLAATETKKLDVLARALKARPGLSLQLAGAADRDADTPVLQKQKLAQFIRSKIWESRREADPSLSSPDQIKITPEENNRVLVGLYVAAFRPQPTQPFPPPAPTGSTTSIIGPERRTPSTPASGSTPSSTTLLGRIMNYIFGGGKSAPPAPAGKPSAPTSAPKPAPAFKLPPPAEMEAQLAAQLPIEDSDLRQLASDRAQQVKDYLVAQGVPEARLSLVEAGAAPGPPAPRVALRLK